jgi:hypothetical protein
VPFTHLSHLPPHALLLQALEKAALKPGSKILVRVGKDLNKGCMAIQLAKRVWRLTVIATCATADMELVLSMGADSTIGESAFDDLTRQSPFECVVDHVREHTCTLPAMFCADGEALVCDSTKHRPLPQLLTESRKQQAALCGSQAGEKRNENLRLLASGGTLVEALDSTWSQSFVAYAFRGDCQCHGRDHNDSHSHSRMVHKSESASPVVRRSGSFFGSARAVGDFSWRWPADFPAAAVLRGRQTPRACPACAGRFLIGKIGGPRFSQVIPWPNGERLQRSLRLLCVATAAMGSANSCRHIGRTSLAKRRIADALQDGLIRPIPQRAFALSDARLERQFAPRSHAPPPCTSLHELHWRSRSLYGIRRARAAHDFVDSDECRGAVTLTIERSPVRVAALCRLSSELSLCASIGALALQFVPCCWHDPLC